MLPSLPGMLGSRKKGNELRDIYSGEEQVPIRAGRWREVGSTAFEGARIKEWRPHWSILHKSHPKMLLSMDPKKRSGNTTRFCIRDVGEHRFPHFATIETHYRQCGTCTNDSMYMN
jgi:hypothetical protein